MYNTSREYPEGPLPIGSIGAFYDAVHELAKSRGYGDVETVSIVNSQNGVHEFVDTSLDALHAVTDLRLDHPGSIAFQSSHYRNGEHRMLRVKLHHGYKVNAVDLVAESAQDMATLVELADHFLSGKPAAVPPPLPPRIVDSDTTVPVSSPAFLDWLEHHPAYRVLVIIGSVAAGAALVWSAVVWIAHFFQ